ncbi:MAG: 2-amino-4-hydroxy-6-hydroxymethyldihydropteridine diphosphokinase [Rhodobacteraceae bacterium]|nr:2-amino-4-hydroxy-6-hydroxymethyldihydropteridine diphosphokinase [Paracoccaceae bacterium]
MLALIALGANLPLDDPTLAFGQHAAPARSLDLLADVPPDLPQAASLRAALTPLEGALGPLCAASRIWRTPAFPPGSGPDFANAAVALTTGLGPAELLQALHRIEALFGRQRETRWGARSLDLDLIALGATIAPDAATLRRWMSLSPTEQRRRSPDGPILPHPRMHERGFVLVPLAEIAPEWVHPATGQSIAAMAAALPASAREGMVVLGRLHTELPLVPPQDPR